MCKVENCSLPSTYKTQDVCQKHYFRFMRNGCYEKIKQRKEKITHSNGYILLFKPNHKLSQSNGYVYEHRFVFFENWNGGKLNCELCGKNWDWSIYNDHIDHIDENKRNNLISNLRPLCNSCNTSRTKVKHCQSKGRISIEYNGVTMTPEEWSREDGVSVKGYVIRNRIKSGWTIKDALFKPSQKCV